MGQAFALARSFFFATLFISLQVWFLPRWVGLRGAWNAPMLELWRWIGLLPCLAGALLMLACVWDFGTKGEGTPAPWDPPRKLVVRGPYRCVRNPMYLGMAMFLCGEAILFVQWQLNVLIYAAVLATITHLFVLVYEEPTLKGKFGDEYRQYLATVPRWIPKRTSPSQ